MLDSSANLLGSVAMFDTAGAVAPTGPDWGRYLIVCTGLISLIVLGGIGARRLLRQSVVVRANRRSIQVHDVLPLGGRQKLAVVRCYDRTFVLGLGDRELTLVGELDAETDLSRTREPDAALPRPVAKATGARAEALARLFRGSQAQGSERKAQFADLLRRLGESGPEERAEDGQARVQDRRRAEPEGEDQSGRRGPSGDRERPGGAGPGRPRTVAEALRGEGWLG